MRSPWRRVSVGSLSCRPGSAAPKRRRFCCDHGTGCAESKIIVVAGVSEMETSFSGVSVLKPGTSPPRPLFSFRRGRADVGGHAQGDAQPSAPQAGPPGRNLSFPGPSGARLRLWYSPWGAGTPWASSVLPAWTRTVGALCSVLGSPLKALEGGVQVTPPPNSP